MTRNSDHYIEVTEIPKSEAFPLAPPRWSAKLSLSPHLDGGESVTFIFTGIFDSEHQARQWAETLDGMLAYKSFGIARIYDL